MSSTYDQICSRQVSSWSVSDVSVFLEHLGLAHLKSIFVKNGVNGGDLLAFSKQEFKEELGCTELQARKIVEAVSALSAPAPPTAPARTTTTTTTTATTTYPQPTMYTTAPAAGVVYNGYYYQPRERYIGGITVLIAVLFCFPCIFCCPIDERDARVAVAMPVQQVQQVQPAQPAQQATVSQVRQETTSTPPQAQTMS